MQKIFSIYGYILSTEYKVFKIGGYSNLYIIHLKDIFIAYLVLKNQHMLKK